jgi:CRP-like cAMP-binding protein
VQGNVKLLSHITPLQLREFMLDSDVRTPPPARRSSSATTTPTPSTRSSTARCRSCSGERKLTLRKGEFFGEMSLISGRRRSATGDRRARTAC